MKSLPLILSASVLLTACGGDDNHHSAAKISEESYVVQTVAADYSSSAVVIGNLSGDRTAANTVLVKDASDYTIDTYGSTLYHIGRYGINTLSRYEATESLEDAEWEYSANDDGATGANPYKIIQTSADNAYVIRYGATTVWQIDPQATSADSFIKDTIDLSAYNADGAATPRMADAVYDNNYLYVVMQRLDSSWTAQTAYVAVIDTTSNEEVDTDASAEGLDGIALNVKNPMAMEAYNGVLYVAGRGDYSSDTGGVDSIDMTTYSVNSVISTSTLSDLNDAETSTYFHILDVALVSDQKGYALVNLEQGYSTVSSLVVPFNPSTLAVADALDIAALADESLSDLAVDGDDRLWVGISDASAPALVVVDTDTNTQNGDTIALEMPPRKISFLTVD